MKLNKQLQINPHDKVDCGLIIHKAPQKKLTVMMSQNNI
jgi:hypothetical protein